MTSDALKQRYFQPSPQLEAEKLPVVNEHYRTHYNAVDQFNTLLGHVPWPYKAKKKSLFMLVHCIRTIAVNVVLAWLEAHHHGEMNPPPLDMKHRFGELADVLLKRN